jgi:hypothetical protein
VQNNYSIKLFVTKERSLIYTRWQRACCKWSIDFAHVAFQFCHTWIHDSNWHYGLLLCHDLLNVGDPALAFLLCIRKGLSSDLVLALWQNICISLTLLEVVPALNQLSITPWRRMWEWMYRFMYSWLRHYLDVSGQLYAPAALPSVPIR